MRMTRRIAVSGVASLAAFALATGPALAHECYNASRSEQGNASAAGSPALMSFQEILGTPEIIGVDLCAAGIDQVLAGLQAAGFRTDVLINGRALMAGGLEDTNPDLLHDGQGIDHLSEAFFATVFPLIGAAAASCAG